MLSFHCARASESRTTYCRRMGHIVIHHRCRSGWLAGRKPTLDALINVAAVGCAIKTGASPMRIVRLVALIALAVATAQQSPPDNS
jgi:hypothetical protein